MRVRVAIVAFACFVAGCGGGGDGDKGTRTPGVFGYDVSRALDARDRGVANPGYPIAVHDVSFASPKGGRVTAFLVVPPGKGRHPAVLYLHGSGGSRLEQLVPATWMAARGAVALTVDSPDARAGRQPNLAGIAGLKAQRDLTVKTIVELRRAVDYLASRSDVDADRIAFVGYSAGARTGAIFAGVEPRVDSFDLMSGGAIPVERYARAAPQSLRGPIRRSLGDVDPLRYIGKAAPGHLLFQDGRRDQIIPREALTTLYRAAGEPKEIRWYDSGHSLNDTAYRDQLRWLAKRLGLHGPTAEHVTTGP